jgi:signal transduction histidine kinase
VRLRARLGLTLLVATLPLGAGVLWLRATVEASRFDEQMREFALASMEAGERERCEAAPERFLIDTLGAGHEGPGRGSRLFAYTAAFTSAQPRAPRPPEDLVARLRGGSSKAGGAWEEGPHEGRQVLLRTAWTDGPCAVLLVQRPWSRPPWHQDVFLWALVALALGLLVAAVAAGGPLVRRIRRLGQAAASSARTGYAEPLGEHGEDELGELARTFEEAGHEVRANLTSLESRERTLREFVSNTTHDVAIPLTVLQGHLARLRRRQRAGEALEPDVLQDALDESHYIACLLQNLSAVARMEAAPERLVKHPVDLVALVDRVLARHRPTAQGRDVTLVHAVPPVPVWTGGDVTLLEQAVSNLVHNGVRHGRQGGHVGVVLMAPRGGAPRFVLRVFDDGRGVPEEELPRLTERRYRGSQARTRAPGGAGLGLAIANEVCAKHGFTLSLRRAEVGGLEAEIVGPLSAL